LQPNLSGYAANIEGLIAYLEEYDRDLENAATVLDALGNLQDALQEAAEDARVIDDFIDDLRGVATFLKLFPPTRSFGTGLDRLLDRVAQRTEQIAETLQDHSREISLFGHAITAADLAVQALQLDVANDLGDVAAIRASLLDLQDAMNEDPAGLSQETRAAIDEMESLFAQLNARFPQEALDAMAGATSDLDVALAAFSGIDRVVTGFRDGIDAVSGLLLGIGDPLGEVVDVLDPLLWVLERAESLIDRVVSPVIDPITEALGIDALLDEVDRLIGGLLPDLNLLNPLDNITADFNGIFGEGPDFSQPLISAIEGIYGARDDLPGDDPTQFLASRIFGEESYLGALLASGTADPDVLLGRNELIFWRSELAGFEGQDVLSAGIGSDTLLGGAGNDVLINAGGDDVLDGGAGFDTLYSNAPLSEFSFITATRLSGGAQHDVLYLNHLGGYLGGLVANFGQDEVIDVESFVFGLTVLTYDQLATAIRVNYAVSNEVLGTGEADLLLGGEQADRINGLAGDDIVIASAGGDTVDGGAGVDVADYSAFATGVRAALRSSDAVHLGNMTDVLTGIENLLGSSLDDLLVGSDGANRLNGTRGDDTLAGLGGDDVLVLGQGADIAAGGAGNDLIQSYYGMDSIVAGLGNDTYRFGPDGNAGDLLFYGLTNDDLLGGTPAVAFAELFAADPTITLPYRIVVNTDAADWARIRQYDASGQLTGSDSATVNGANIIGTDRNDSFQIGAHFAFYAGGLGHDSFVGTSDNLRDRITGAEPIPPGARIFGGAGTDILTSYTMEESFVGGAGNDRYVFVETDQAPDALRQPVEDRQPAYFFGGSAPESFGQMDQGTDPVTGLPVFTPRDPGTIRANQLTDTGVDTIDLSDGERYWLIDVENGVLGSEDFIGRWGISPFGVTDNVLRFTGVEVFLGGILNDWMVHGDTNITFWAGRGRDTILPGLGGGLGNLEAHGGQGDDYFNSGLGLDSLYGDDGNDFLRNNGNRSATPGAFEVLSGGSGNDFLTIGSYGTAYSGMLTDFDGGAGQDFAEFYLSAGQRFFINMGGSGYTLDGVRGGFENIEGIIVHGADAEINGTYVADAIQSGDGADLLVGFTGDDILASGEGDDTLRGGFGNDILAPGLGNATVDGGDGQDALQLHGRFNYQDGSGVSFRDGGQRIVGWYVDLAASLIVAIGGDMITYSNIERFVGGGGDDTMLGSDGADYMDGHARNDSIDGGSGDDTLLGGAGNDTITGDAGDDIIGTGTGFDRALGGAGHDVLQIEAEMQGVLLRGLMGLAAGTVYETYEVAPGAGVFTTVAYPSVDRFAEFEEIVLTKFDDDAEGSAAGDHIQGALGNDTLRGLGGSDTLSGGAGNDLLIGDGATALPALAYLDQTAGSSGLRIDNFAMPTGALTFEMMLRADPVFQPYSLISYGVSGSTNEFLLITEDTASTLRFLINGVVIETTVAASEIYDGELHRLSVTWNSAYGWLQIFVDGAIRWQEFNIAAAQTPITSGGTLIFGQDQDGSVPGGQFQDFQSYHGAIGDIRVFDTQRSEELIAENVLRENGALSDETGLVAAWSFDPDAEDQQISLGEALQTFGIVTIEDINAETGTHTGDSLNGGDGSDTLIGGVGDDTLVGGTSTLDVRDILYGGDGQDALDGGYGNDELRGDAGDDTIIGGFGVDLIVGGDGNDQLTGQAWSDEIYGGEGDDFINGGFGHDRVNGGSGADRFFHIGVSDHGSDWIQDYNAAQGDVLQFGISGTRDQFQVNFTETAGAGVSGVQEAFIIFRPTGHILWALVDGGGQSQINLLLDGVSYDLLG